MKESVLVAATIALCLGLLVFGRGAHEGSVEVTVIPGDAVNLGCEGTVAELSCAGPRPLRPFVTTSGRLVALPGLFEEPAVSQWLQHPKTPDERVRVRCRARSVVLGTTLGVRFSATDVFRPGALDVADISACELR